MLRDLNVVLTGHLTEIFELISHTVIATTC